jgi:hypothetical protein
VSFASLTNGTAPKIQLITGADGSVEANLEPDDYAMTVVSVAPDGSTSSSVVTVTVDENTSTISPISVNL